MILNKNNRNLILLCIVFGFTIFSCRDSVGVDEKESLSLNFQELIQPTPSQAKLIDDEFYIWGASMVKSADGQYHLYYSRWPRELGFQAWVTHSEIAHAVASDPLGPYQFRDVALSERGKEYWDGLVTHNPSVHRFGEKYYLYYMGNTGDRDTTDGFNWNHRNNQRIGVAVAEHPNGPWKRFEEPLIDVSPDSNAMDALMVSNPTITPMPDGNFLLIYKAVGKKNELPFGGPVVLMVAVSDSPTGPFKKHNEPVFTAEDSDFPAEDPFIWYQGSSYWAILKDMHGAFTDAGQALVLFRSTTGFDWQLADHPLVTTPEIYWKDNMSQNLYRLERPSIWFNDQAKPAVLFLAAMDTTGVDYSFNVHVPLGWQ